MSASTVLGRDLDVLPTDIAVRVFVLNANIREMNLVVKVGQVVLTCPFLNLLDRSIGPAIAVAIPSIALLEETLVLAFELPVQFDPEDAGILVAEALGGFQVRPIHRRVMRALAGSVGAGVEPLRTIGVALSTAVTADTLIPGTASVPMTAQLEEACAFA